MPSIPPKTSPEDWGIYEGDYQTSSIGLLRVTVENQKLILRIPDLDFETELKQFGGPLFIWSSLPRVWLERENIAEGAYAANPVFSSSFVKKPGSADLKTDLLVTRLAVGVRK